MSLLKKGITQDRGASHSYGPGPQGSCDRGGWARTRAAPRPPLRASRLENDASAARTTTASPDPTPRLTNGVLGPRKDLGRPQHHLTDERTSRMPGPTAPAPACARRRNAIGRRHRPAVALQRAGSPLALGSTATPSQTCSRGPSEELNGACRPAPGVNGRRGPTAPPAFGRSQAGWAGRKQDTSRQARLDRLHDDSHSTRSNRGAGAQRSAAETALFAATDQRTYGTRSWRSRQS